MSKDSRTHQRRQKSNLIQNTRWAGYAAAGAVTTIVGHETAEAAIVHIDIPDITLSAP